MQILNEKQIKYGCFYFHRDEPRQKAVVEVSQYDGESSLEINCTQLGDSFTPQYKTPKEKKRVLQEWCQFLSDNTTAFTELSFNTRMPQELFDAVCGQKNLKRLQIKWGAFTDISKLAELSELEYLYIGSGTGVQSIDPIATLEKLVALHAENFQRIEDYGPFAKLKRLEALTIEGNGLSPQYIHTDSLDFLIEMKQLRFFHFMTARLRSKDITPVLYLEELENLSLMKSKEVIELYDELIRLPKLKYGLLLEKPELYKQ